MPGGQGLNSLRGGGLKPQMNELHKELRSLNSYEADDYYIYAQHSKKLYMHLFLNTKVCGGD
jgi:hypothetical protein